VAKVRIDQLLVTLGFAETRSRAQSLLLAGKVVVNDTRIDKAGTLVSSDAEVRVKGEDLKYVSRGGTKLEGALKAFNIEVHDLRCLDVGASTGGFTDCLLQRGAAHVIAVDVGYGQLAEKLRVDPRVSNRERTNAKALTAGELGGAVDLTVVDASFIGLHKLLDAIRECTKPGGHLLALIKPQFEVGREEAARGKGVIKDTAVRQKAIEDCLRDVQNSGFSVLGWNDCVLPGPKGNVEAFVYARRT